MDQQNLNEWVEKVSTFWKGQGIKLEPGITEKEILAVGRRLDFEFPASFIALYQRVNGFKDYDWTSDMFSIWPLDRILQEHTDKAFIGFCDYLICSHCIGFLASDGRIYKDHDLGTPIATTFDEAINLINTNSDLIY